MQVVANGRPRPVDAGWTVSDFVESLGFDPRYVVVELNGDALERKRFTEVKLAEGDAIEIVRPVAGG